jgi:2,4-dienoyl-CoA reductase-like NADH-dependent reductase (Old Yellow Enzyme family)
MLFEPITINGKLTLPNRIVMPPAVTRLATVDGDVTPELIDRYLLYAKGGTGLVLMEAVSVETQKSGQLLRLNEDRYIEGFRHLAERVHAETEAKIAPQILHFMKIARSGYRQKVEDLELDYVKAMPKMWADAAYRSREAGMDAVELHFAHAYTLASFLSRYNKRKDEYGGAKMENRMRLMSEIIVACRAAVGDDFCLGCRINGDEFSLGGNTLIHSRQIALRCAELGLDYVSVSAGGKFEDAVPEEGEALDPYTGYSGTRTMPPSWMPEKVNLYLAADIKETLRGAGYTIPVIGAGRVPSAPLAEEILSSGDIDLMGICRPILCDPYWPTKWQEGRDKDILKCTYCNACREMEGGFTTVECIQWKKKGQPEA